MPFLLLTCLAAYLIGAIPFGYLIARWRGVDIFQSGSGNIGATNVGRVLGRKFGILVFWLDFAKGAVPVVLARLVQRHAGDAFLDELPDGLLEVLAGLAAFLGHLFPVYLRFRGGKGVATGTGVVAVLVPFAAMVAAATWFLVVLASRYVSLASISAALVLVLAQLRTHGMPPDGFVEDPRSWFCLLAAGMVVARHRSNVVRLLEGRENRLRENAFMSATTRVCHLLAVGLWFGSAVFFSFIVAPTLFSRFQDLAARPEAERAWFPHAPMFAKSDEAINGPRERGSWAAGYAISPLFPLLFLLQGTCGFAAVATALPWMRTQPGGRVHLWRVTVLLAGLSCVLAAWPLETHVRTLQGARHAKTLAYLSAPPEQVEQARTEMEETRAEFGRWHLASLGLNMFTILLVTVALGMAAFLPGEAARAAGPVQEATHQPLPTGAER